MLLVANGLEKCKPNSTPGIIEPISKEEIPLLSKSEHKEYRKNVGQLLWLSTVRKDIQFPVKDLSKKLHNPNKQDQSRVTHVLKYLSGTIDRKITILPSQDSVFKIICMTDADLGNCEISRKSTSGGHIAINNSLIHSWSKQQQTVALSSAESEFIAMAAATSEVLYVKSFFEELHLPIEVPVILTASKSDKDMLEKRTHGRVKHVDRKICFIKDIFEKGLIRYKHIPGGENVADLLTKYVSKQQLLQHRDALLS